jgi:hypothetical protein
MEYAQTAAAHEYSPHPFSSASIAARQGTAIQYPSSYPVAEGPSHPSTSRGSERAPPSSFPHHHTSSGNRPRSGHSSEGDETKAGYGKYECEYCSKRFNRPSSLRVSSRQSCPYGHVIHFNLHRSTSILTQGQSVCTFHCALPDVLLIMKIYSLPVSLSKLWASFQCDVQYEASCSNTWDPPCFRGGR